MLIDSLELLKLLKFESVFLSGKMNVSSLVFENETSLHQLLSDIPSLAVSNLSKECSVKNLWALIIMSCVLFSECLDCVCMDKTNIIMLCIVGVVFPYIKWMVLRTGIWKFEILGSKPVFVLNVIAILCLCGNIFFSGMSMYYLSTGPQTSFGSQVLIISSLFFSWCSGLVMKTVLFTLGGFIHANSNIHNILWYILVIYGCFVFSFKLRYKIWFIFQLKVLLSWIFLMKVL